MISETQRPEVRSHSLSVQKAFTESGVSVEEAHIMVVAEEDAEKAGLGMRKSEAWFWMTLVQRCLGITVPAELPSRQ